MTTSLVSVVIPCRNARSWIGEAIESALAQRGVDLEIVMVDDGSDDDSVAVAEAAGGSSLTVLRQSKKGVSQARNAGTRQARGRFLQYLDADDVLMPDTLAAKVEALITTGAEVAYSNWIRWELQADGTFADGPILRRTLGDRPDVSLLVDAWWPPGALLYSRTVVDRISMWREDLPIIQDARFLLDAALQKASFVHVDLVGMKYRVHGSNSVSSRDPRSFLEDCYRNASDLQTSWEQDRTLDEERRRGLLKVYAYLARSFYPLDRSRFDAVVGHLHALDPHFVPDRRFAFRTLSRLLGYPKAEQVAGWWRHLKASI